MGDDRRWGGVTYVRCNQKARGPIFDLPCPPGNDYESVLEVFCLQGLFELVLFESLFEVLFKCAPVLLKEKFEKFKWRS